MDGKADRLASLSLEQADLWRGEPSAMIEVLQRANTILAGKLICERDENRRLMAEIEKLEKVKK